jgi:hypothetical protein
MINAAANHELKTLRDSINMAVRVENRPIAVFIAAETAGAVISGLCEG